jgi:hypothetical protein
MGSPARLPCPRCPPGGEHPAPVTSTWSLVRRARCSGAGAAYLGQGSNAVGTGSAVVEKVGQESANEVIRGRPIEVCGSDQVRELPRKQSPDYRSRDCRLSQTPSRAQQRHLKVSSSFVTRRQGQCETCSLLSGRSQAVCPKEVMGLVEEPARKARPQRDTEWVRERRHSSIRCNGATTLDLEKPTTFPSVKSTIFLKSASLFWRDQRSGSVVESVLNVAYQDGTVASARMML